MKQKPSQFLKNMNWRFFTRYLLMLSLFFVILIPCDVLAVYFLEAPVKSIDLNKASLTAFSFDKPAVEIASFKETVGSSAMFGTITGSGVVNLIDATDELKQTLALKGIVSLGGKDAIFQDRETKKSLFLKQGDTFKNWSLKEIKDDSVLFSDGKNETELKIEEHAA